MATVNDFMQTYMMIENIKNTRTQLEQQAMRDRAGAFSILDSALANITDPAARQQVVSAIETDFGFEAGQLAPFATGRIASGAAQQAGAVEAGLAAMPMEERGALSNVAAYRALGGMTPTGMRLEQRTGDLMLGGIDSMEQRGIGVDEIMAMRQLFGQSPGQFAVDQATAGLPGNELTEIAGIQGGTRASAGDVLSATGQAAAIRANTQGQMLDYSLGLAGLNQRAQELAAATQAEGRPVASAKELTDNIISMVGQLREGGELGGGGEQFLQGMIATHALTLMHGPLNPFPDLDAGPKRQGETDQQYAARLQAVTNEAVTRILGTQNTRPQATGGGLMPTDIPYVPFF